MGVGIQVPAQLSPHPKTPVLPSHDLGPKIVHLVSLVRFKRIFGDLAKPSLCLVPSL
jgi:hypothetical protein